MMSEVFCSRVVCRSASSHAALTQFSARQTCSVVTSAFFPPQLGRPTGCERQRDQAQLQVPHQPHVTAALEMTQTDFTLAGAQAVLHVPTRKTDTQAQAQRRPLRAGGDEV